MNSEELQLQFKIAATDADYGSQLQRPPSGHLPFFPVFIQYCRCMKSACVIHLSIILPWSTAGIYIPPSFIQPPPLLNLWDPPTPTLTTTTTFQSYVSAVIACVCTYLCSYPISKSRIRVRSGWETWSSALRCLFHPRSPLSLTDYQIKRQWEKEVDTQKYLQILPFALC